MINILINLFKRIFFSPVTYVILLGYLIPFIFINLYLFIVSLFYVDYICCEEPVIAYKKSENERNELFILKSDSFIFKHHQGTFKNFVFDFTGPFEIHGDTIFIYKEKLYDLNNDTIKWKGEKYIIKSINKK